MQLIFDVKSILPHPGKDCQWEGTQIYSGADFTRDDAQTCPTLVA